MKLTTDPIKDLSEHDAATLRQFDTLYYRALTLGRGWSGRRMVEAIQDGLELEKDIRAFDQANPELAAMGGFWGFVDTGEDAT